MTATTKLYVGLVILAGSATLAASATRWESHGIALFMSYLLLGALTSALKIKLPGVEGTYSINFLVILGGVHNLSLAENLLLCCLCALVQTFWKVQVKPEPVQLFFNVAVLVLSTAAAHLLLWVGLAHLGGSSLVRYVLPVGGYFIVDTGLVSGVLSLAEHRSFWGTWDYWATCSLVYYAIGAGLVWLVSVFGRQIHGQVIWATLPLTYLLYRQLRSHIASVPCPERAA